MFAIQAGIRGGGGGLAYTSRRAYHSGRLVSGASNVDVLSWVMVAAGLGLLVVGAEVLVRGASGLAARLGISELVVGLTVVAFGTSAPELAVTVVAAVEGTGDLAFGNVVGSNLFNGLAILGVSALVAPLVVDRKLVRFDVPVMIAASVVVGLMALDGGMGRLDGAILLVCLAAYLLLSIRIERRRMEADAASGGRGPVVEKRVPNRVAWMIVGVVGGLGLLVLGSHLLVTGAVQVARAFGVSERVIGLTLVAAGTSLPEMATSVVASLRGQRDIAVGNIVGSNLFNLLCVLALAATILPLPVAADALRVDVPVMVGAAVVCFPIFRRGWSITRLEGAALLVVFGTYLTWVLMTGQAG